MEKRQYIPIVRNGFYISAISFCVFAVAEVLRPGFVSWHIPFLVFILVTLIFGGAWLSLDPHTEQDHPILKWMTIGGLGIVTAMWGWIIFFLLPFIVARVLKRD